MSTTTLTHTPTGNYFSPPTDEAAVIAARLVCAAILAAIGLVLGACNGRGGVMHCRRRGDSNKGFVTLPYSQRKNEKNLVLDYNYQTCMPSEYQFTDSTHLYTIPLPLQCPPHSLKHNGQTFISTRQLIFRKYPATSSY